MSNFAASTYSLLQINHITYQVFSQVIKKYKFRLRVPALVTAFLIFGFHACNLKKGCDKPTKFPVETGFYNSFSLSLRDTILEDITLYGIGREDSLLYNDIDTNRLKYRLSPFSDTTKIILHAFSKVDTLTFYYTRHLELVSQSCGFAMFFDIKEINFTKNFIDSLFIIDHLLDASKTEHLRVFVR